MIKAISKDDWKSCQTYERHSWGTDVHMTSDNGELIKQNTYAQFLGIVPTDVFETIDLQGKSVLDVGCGPISLLLRCTNSPRAVGVEPLSYGEDVDVTYRAHNVDLQRIPAEEMNFSEREFDEVWMYNVLQHVYNPDTILEKIQKYGRTVRIFEWLDIPPHEGHPHMFTEAYFVSQMKLSPDDYKVHKLNTSRLRGKAICIVKKYDA